jgi:hypothetical protein
MGNPGGHLGILPTTQRNSAHTPFAQDVAWTAARFFFPLGDDSICLLETPFTYIFQAAIVSWIFSNPMAIPL